MYGIVSPIGEVSTGTDYTCEDRAWTIAFGWPDAEEIKRAKSQGYYCAVMTVTWEEPE